MKNSPPLRYEIYEIVTFIEVKNTVVGYQGPGRGGKGDLLISVYKASILQFAYVLTTCCAALSLRTAVLAPTLKDRLRGRSHVKCSCKTKRQF